MSGRVTASAARGGGSGNFGSICVHSEIVSEGDDDLGAAVLDQPVAKALRVCQYLRVLAVVADKIRRWVQEEVPQSNRMAIRRNRSKYGGQERQRLSRVKLEEREQMPAPAVRLLEREKLPAGKMLTNAALAYAEQFCDFGCGEARCDQLGVPC